MIPFIGIGTGRCGTRSLANILNGCENVAATHEKYWSGDAERLKQEFAASSHHVFGDVGFYWVNKLDHASSLMPELKVICLCRPKEDTIESFLSMNHKHHQEGFLEQEDWPPTLPNIPLLSPRERVALYYDWYYDIVKTYDDALWINPYDFVKDTVLHDIFDYLQISDKHRRLSRQRQWGHNC